jgi:hypothetical protein
MQIAPAIVMAALSALVIFETSSYPYWSDYSPGPAFAPWWIAACGLLLSGLLVANTYRSEPAHPLEGTGTTLTGFGRAAATFISLVAFVLLIPYLGLVITSVLIALVIMLFILRRAVVPSVFSALCAGGVIYGIFFWWLQIHLPTGPLGF